MDFTEFLNYPGCTRGRHSRVKPVEPEKITGNLNPVDDPMPETRKPISVSANNALPSLKRSNFSSTPLTRLKANIARSLQDQVALMKKRLAEAKEVPAEKESEQTGVKVGEPCKNSGCQTVKNILFNHVGIHLIIT